MPRTLELDIPVFIIEVGFDSMAALTDERRKGVDIDVGQRWHQKGETI